MTLRNLGFYLRGRLSRGVSRLANARAAPLTAVPLDAALRAAGAPLPLVPLLEGRSNAEREAAVAAYLELRGVPFVRHRFTTFEGAGENFGVDVGRGDRLLVLVAHHDAVPGSPGANDNAAAVAILLTLIERLAAAPPSRLRVRFLFTAAEESGYLGARAYVADTPLDRVLGVLSLELCGIGDSVAVWDAGVETPFLAAVCRALGGLGLAADADYHVVGRIPVFGSDHRAFAAAGMPAYGLTAVPRREADALRSFVFNPVRSALTHLVRRPPPFDTYHTRRDARETLDASALDLVIAALGAIAAELE
ncbi:MAG: M20/M25/M40 family metallo-hydrolase [Candidatus Rokubacteria bacterium]|nr:M20/M25/M40 family metallo-hydrolase [Candidatus Rokubacteria bacterium]